MNRGWHGWVVRVGMAAGVGLLAIPGTILGATFPLTYRTNGPSADFRLPLEKSEIRFKHEPEYAGTKVVRSQFFVAPDQKDYIGFACDFEGRKLYLDLNRNLDLTDDPDGILESKSDNWGQEFTGVTIPVEQDGCHREMVVDLRIYGEKWGRYTIRSSWGSDAVVIGSKTCRVDIVDDGDGVFTPEDTLFFQPIGSGGKEDVENQMEMQVPTSLVLDGQSYALSYKLSTDGKTIALSVVPGGEKLVDVPLTGQGVERLLLQDSGHAAVFYHPGSKIQLLTGRYRAEAWVRIGTGKQTSLWQSRQVNLTIRDGAVPEPWAIGGPIVSKLTYTMSGSRVTFNQAATGAAGESYSLVNSTEPALKKPKLRIKHGGKVIHVGEFEYG